MGKGELCMQITSREDALIAPPTPKSKLRKFEQRLYEIHECSFWDLLVFLDAEKTQFVFPSEIGLFLEGIETLRTGKLKLKTIKHWGDPLGCDFQFRKVAKRRSRKTTPLPQRFHGRVYLEDQEIVVVTETETDPEDIPSGIVHLIESHEHQIIRLRRKY